MVAAAPEPHRPGAGEADRRVARWPEQSDGRDRAAAAARYGARPPRRRPAQRLDLGLDPREQIALGLGAAAHRLVERLVGGVMEGAEPVRQGVERRQPVGEIVDSDEAVVALEPLPARIARSAARRRRDRTTNIGCGACPSACAGALARAFGPAGPEQMPDIRHGQSRCRRAGRARRTGGRRPRCRPAPP